MCLLLNIAAFCCLIPGLVLPLLVVNVFFGDMLLLSQVRSIVGTVKYLHEEGADLPAVLIAIFSIAVPIVKFLMLLSIVLLPSYRWRSRIYAVVRDWSKWSMADVFVTAVFVASLSANAKPTTMTASVGTGFYCFLAYCLLSLAALQIMPKPKKPTTSSSSPSHSLEEHHPLHVITTERPVGLPKSTVEMEQVPRQTTYKYQYQEQKNQPHSAALPASHERPAEPPHEVCDDLHALVGSDDDESAEDRRRGGVKDQHQREDLDEINLLEASQAGRAPSYAALRVQKTVNLAVTATGAASSPRVEESF